MTGFGQRAPETSYYVMGCEGLFPATMIGNEPELPRGPWMTGQLITYTDEIREPLVFELDPGYPGPLRPMYKADAPLMREDLLKALAEAGVDNLQPFPALLRDPTSGEEHSNYKAVNVVGVI